MNKRKILYILIIAFIINQFTLSYFAQTANNKDIIKYIIVIFAFLFNFIFIKKNYIFLFTQLALLFTLIADFFLVILDDYYLISVIIFSLTQICYCIRIFLETKNLKIKKINLIIRICLVIISIVLPFLILKPELDLLSVFTLFYFSNLIINSIFACINSKNYKYAYIFAIGLILFVLCDIVVGIYNLDLYFNIENNSFITYIINNNINYSWVFYVPSQTLLAISLIGYEI